MQGKKLQETKLWDKDLLLKRVLDNEEIYKAVLLAFVEDMPQLTTKLSEEIVKQNFIEIASLAHNMKGSALNVTANDLSVTARDIELAAKEQNINQITVLSRILEEQLSLLLSELSAQL